MVLPEDPTPRDRPRSQPRAALIGGTVLIVLIGIFALGSFTTPESASEAGPTSTADALVAPTTTTLPPDPATFRIVDIQQGHQPWWGRGFNPPNGEILPMHLAQIDGEILLLGRSSGWAVRNPNEGIRLWTSDDGVFWSDKGEVIGPEVHVERFHDADGKLFALAGGGLVLTSDDGQSWTTETLPHPGEPRGLEIHRPYLIGSNGERQVIFSTIVRERIDEVRPFLPAEVAAALDGGYEWGFASSGQLRISGPLGITVITVDLEEAGVPDDIRSRLFTGSRLQHYVWVRDAAGPWQVTEFEADWVDTVHVGDDGKIEVLGHHDGHRRWTSSDGVSWESTVRPMNLDVIHPFGGGFIGFNQHPPDVALSSDGEEWESIGLEELLPETITWGLWPVVANESGLAAFLNAELHDPQSGAEAVIVEKDGYLLTIDFPNGIIELDRLENGTAVPVYTIGMHAHDPNPLVATDLESGTYTFLEDGEPLLTLSFDEVEEIEAAIRGFVPPFLQGLVYSHDGVQWTIQDVTQTFNGERISTALVTDDRVIAVTVPAGNWNRSVPEPTVRIGLIQRRGSG